MNNEPLSRFLSEKSIFLHKEYLKNEKAKYSIFEKSFPEIVGRSFYELYAMRSLKRSVKEEAIALLANINLHELYFSSFCQNSLPCKEIKEYYSSESAFLYEAWLLGREKRGGFLYFYLDRRGKPCVAYTDTGIDAFLKAAPCLAIDLCEHAYFLDYGFEGGEYLRRALGFLDISRLTDKS